MHDIDHNELISGELLMKFSYFYAVLFILFMYCNVVYKGEL